ncbi:L,D-transpeptidase family protein [Candidatus Stoquefichus sp. SB1]|uniref:L,D-transpeptidase family protein n=1 Tax=Candidatus Stoquefichus sp. SB1 TaxID=1658109 RepID=UPI00067E7BA8|nr:L,D-transpeptidase family protein [Candidatus Stoquefichus sp. SB1]
MTENDNQTQVQTDTPKKRMKRRIRLKKEYYRNVGIGCIFIILAGYAFGCFYYHDKFMAQTTINGISVSGLSPLKATQKIENTIQNQSLTLIFSDGEKETITQQDCGIVFNTQNDISQSLKKQNTFLWFIHYFTKTNITIDNLFTVQQQTLQKKISSLTHLSSQQIEPIDAKVTYKDQNFTITKESYGSKINQEQLIKAILQAFSEQKTEINVQDVHGYEEPKVLSTDQKLQKLCELAKQYCNASITYQTTTGDVVLDGNTLIEWISIDEKGNYYYSEEEFKKQANAFVKELAKKINIIGKSKTFTGAQGQKTVSGGNYGYRLNQDKEVSGLLADIKAGKHTTRKPIVTGIQAAYENGGLGQTFVEIDMSKQHMWLIKNGKVVLESDVVTGLPSDPNKKTPAGTYYIYFMQRNRVLRGEIQANGKPEYETPVAYWMAFNGGIGLHDASWQSRFGGNVYYTKGSHGCVNLPKNIAASLYDMVKVNIPVVCYY